MRENIPFLFHHFCCYCSASSFVASVTSAAGWDWGFGFWKKSIFPATRRAETSVTSSTKWRPPVRQVESPFIPSLSFARVYLLSSHHRHQQQRQQHRDEEKNQQHQQQKLFLAFASDCVYLYGSVEMNRVFFLLFFHLHSAAAAACLPASLILWIKHVNVHINF